MDGKNRPACLALRSMAGREDVKIGSEVEVILKENQRTGILTHGIVAEILTSSSFHPHGIKVRLEDGQVGRVQNIIPPAKK